MNAPGRYRVTLTISGNTALTGWWSDLAVATDRYGQVIGKHGRPGSSVQLAERDGNDWRVLKTWPATASATAADAE
ncbi:hypothetical protein C9F11_38565 [Streptomyces sp. YIM 121038]|uniref:hypothetical protein n=1 Tax=Streptomyces sp. YIM 121038 TaxID=2136401 RepID=UPI0011108396|nr:hypothetical protein [Streptomyces sp. YIM 121038]QCX81296.1 hypothetical protein C9F11_38565 [Streptomyces sp. YIM 121038]